METKGLKRLPVGIQTYSEIVNLNCVYIDNSFSIQPLNQNIYDEPTEIKRIDLFI